MFSCRIKIQIITFIVYIYAPYEQQHTLAARFDSIYTNKASETTTKYFEDISLLFLEINKQFGKW